MSEELKVRSFRADNETFEKFKQLAEGEFGNQGQCLSALINLYETEKSKAILVNRGLEIESFQDYLNKISGLFLTSLQINQDTENRVREEFARQLDSKDKTIFDLQTKNDDLKVAKEAFEESAKLLKEENKELQSKVIEAEKIIEKRVKDFNSVIADKDNLNNALTDNLSERKSEIESLKRALEDRAKELQNKDEKLKAVEADEQDHIRTLQVLESQNKKLAVEVNNLSNQLEREKELAEIAKEKALTALEKSHQAEITKVNEQHNNKIQTLLEKIEKLQEQPKEKKEVEAKAKATK